MTYTYTDLLNDVRKEAEALRVHATKEERERLDTNDLDPQQPTECYYGLMTGSCTSPRAHELITKCCIRLIDNMIFRSDDINSLHKTKFYEVNSTGDLMDLRQVSETETYLEYISPIEAYILLPEARNDNLISYLRGETETLEL